MSNLFKICISCLVIFLLFKLGYNKAADLKPGASKNNRWHGRSRVASANLLSPGSLVGKSHFFINGMPADLEMYTTKNTIAKEVVRFERQWQSKGYEPVTQSVGSAKIISAFDENKKIFQSTIILPDPLSGKTAVIPAKLDLRKPPTNGHVRTLFCPQAQTLFHLESNDFGGYSENLILMSDASVSTVMNYYTSQFSQQGWHIADKPDSPISPNDSEMRLFLRGSDERWVSASRMDGQNKTAIFLLYNDKY